MSIPFEQFGLDAQTLAAAHCEYDFACLGDDPICVTEQFVYRDVEMIRCRSEFPCGKRRSFDGLLICTCPVQKRLHS